jgi:hypothetical protein
MRAEGTAQDTYVVIGFFVFPLLFGGERDGGGSVFFLRGLLLVCS